MKIIRKLASSVAVGALAACSSYSPALNEQPAGKSAVYALDIEQAKQIVYSSLEFEYSPSSYKRGRILPLPAPEVGYSAAIPPYNSMGWTTIVVITPVTALVDNNPTIAVRIEVRGSTMGSPVAGNVFYSEFKAHLKSELDNSGSLRFVDHYSVRVLPPPAPERPPIQDQKGTGSIGTAFAVLTNHTLVTAFHVIDGAKNIEVTCGSGPSTQATVGKVDPANDLALILITGSAAGYLHMSAESSLQQGQRVFTMGFPAPDVLGYEAKYSEGAVSSLSGIQGAASLLQMTVPVQPGNSGGPLLDEFGNVVGVVTSSAAVEAFLRHTGTLPQNINWAVKSEYLHPLLSGIPVDSTLTAGSAIGRAQKSVCLVKAYN